MAQEYQILGRWFRSIDTEISIRRSIGHKNNRFWAGGSGISIQKLVSGGQ
jgi:hypothetical protein